MGSSQSSATQDRRLEVVLPLLRRRCQILCAEYDAPRRYSDEKAKMRCELKSLWQTPSADVSVTIGEVKGLIPITKSYLNT